MNKSCTFNSQKNLDFACALLEDNAVAKQQAFQLPTCWDVRPGNFDKPRYSYKNEFTKFGCDTLCDIFKSCFHENDSTRYQKSLLPAMAPGNSSYTTIRGRRTQVSTHVWAIKVYACPGYKSRGPRTQVSTHVWAIKAYACPGYKSQYACLGYKSRGRRTQSWSAYSRQYACPGYKSRGRRTQSWSAYSGQYACLGYKSRGRRTHVSTHYACLGYKSRGPGYKSRGRRTLVVLARTL
ncbi:hypothetical protein DPMN_138518 [Dreissena polymorpha]|uniref:Uncharacterized protein n=1 Tax=Dreissena polymorpha TaxID=45954 RepID=A0A9D4G4L9_DREPO|nr:hypothetical protein DPMN_138518 [Dreissena polymorpha]